MCSVLYNVEQLFEVGDGGVTLVVPGPGDAGVCGGRAVPGAE